MKKILQVMGVLILAIAAMGQNQPITGSITTATAGPGNCVTARAQNNSAVGIDVSGTFVGTLQPTVQIASVPRNKKVLPLDGSTAQSTITGTGLFLANVGGVTQIGICASAWTSGTAVVTIYATPAPNNSTIASTSGGSGTVTSVTFTGDGVVDSSTPSAAVTSSGTVTATVKNQTANYVLAGPTSGAAAASSFRALVGPDLPAPTATTLGGIESITSASHNWLAYVDTSGVPHQSQPAFTDISGTASNAQIPAALLATGTSISLTAPTDFAVCTSTCTVTPPVPAAGYQFCIMNDDNVSTVITLAALGSSALYEKTARTGYGTAGTGTLTSGGAVGDAICLVGRDSTHYLSVSYTGTWTTS